MEGVVRGRGMEMFMCVCRESRGQREWTEERLLQSGGLLEYRAENSCTRIFIYSSAH